MRPVGTLSAYYSGVQSKVFCAAFVGIDTNLVKVEVDIPSQGLPGWSMVGLLETAVKEAKGSVQAPKSIDFVAQLPLSALGKPDKKALRKQFWGDHARGVN